MNPEPDVKSLARHLQARFVENGVPADDVELTAASIGSWEQWCRGWERTADERAAQAAVAEAEDNLATAAELRLVAALEYHFGKFLFVHDTDQMRAVHAKAVTCYRQASGELPWPGRVVEVPFGATTLPGVLRLPHGADGPAATVVVVPGLDATKEEMHRFSEAFLRRGMATFTFDGPGQGESEYVLPLRPDWEVVADATLQALAHLDEVDGTRMGVAGVSLGGYFAARAMAAGVGFVAGATVGGCYSMGQCWDALSPLSRQAFIVRSGSPDEETASTRAHDFSLAHVPASGAGPLLVVHGERDRLFDTDQARATAAHFGERSTLVLEPRGNHVLHNLAFRVRPAVADWMASRLHARREALL